MSDGDTDEDMEGMPQDAPLTAVTRQRLAQLTELPTPDHVAVFDGIHQSLAEALSQVAEQTPSNSADAATPRTDT